MRTIGVPNGSQRTIDKFYWWPQYVWDTEAQADVMVWMERVRVRQWRLGGRWCSDVLWNDAWDEICKVYPADVRKVFEELGVK